jgi:hypothetical protein
MNGDRDSRSKSDRIIALVVRVRRTRCQLPSSPVPLFFCPGSTAVLAAMVDTSPFSTLVAAATDRQGIAALVAALGFRWTGEEAPSEAWSAWGVPAAPDIRALVLAGKAGSLDALLFEMAGECPADRASALAAGVRSRNPVRLHLLVFSGPAGLLLGTYGVDGEFRHLPLEPGRVRGSDVDALEEMAARPGESGLALALRQARALDRTRVTRLFFKDFRAHRGAVADAFTGLPAEADRDRAQLALLFLCRLTFLYFLQRRGTLCGDDRYLVRLFTRWDASAGTTFYRGRLVPLFFDALNRPAEQRSGDSRALGPLPYLNGGLFEPHAIERAHPGLDLPDLVVGAVLHGLLERYRFTSREATAGAGYGVDPEVLGQVFEGLMAPGDRLDTGSFYTPAPVVRRVVREGLAEYLRAACPGVDPAPLLDGEVATIPIRSRQLARRSLERIRVLDPACGSGAFLLGALHYLARATAALSGEAEAVHRREVVAGALHGVDLLDDAALLCSLRLWLALSEADETVRPLPNLDRRIRQGDALVEPVDLSTPESAADPASDPLGDPELRAAYRAVGPAARRYLESGMDGRSTARQELAAAERELARRWLARAGRLHGNRIRALRATTEDRDLFGDIPRHAHQARGALRDAEQQAAEILDATRKLEEKGSLPFFSFGIHFAEAGGAFDFIVSNPPWVRAHRWPERLRRLALRQYEACRAPGWLPPARSPGQVVAAGSQLDLSLLFLERSVRLLAPGGVLAILIPAKALRALYGASTRRMLLRDLEFVLIEDHALDQRSIFRADAFAAVLILRRTRSQPRPEAPPPIAAPDQEVRVRMVRRGTEPLEFRARAADLPLFEGDPASPWLIAPPEVAVVLRRMQRAGRPLGEHPGFRVRRGVMTGANEVLVLSSVSPKLGGLARVEATGFASARRRGTTARAAGRYRAYLETSSLRPLVRGADIDAFRYRAGAHVIWCHDQQGGVVEAPPRLHRYLHRHREALEARPGWKPGRPLGSVFRITADTLQPKVAWHDLSDRLRAVALPARVSFDGAERELIPLNTAYFLPVPDERDALLLSAILNSLPVGVFARAIAERAKDARFRFFAWTMACLPLPEGWRTHAAAPELVSISSLAHSSGGISEEQQRRLDLAAAALFGLDAVGLVALGRFDRWLRGIP